MSTKKQQQRPKKHHYCPEFYLKGFVNENGKLWKYRKNRFGKYDNFKEVSPSGVMYEIDGYAFPTIFDRQDSTLESVFFKKLDNEWYGVLEKIRNDGDGKELPLVIPDELTMLFEFIAWQQIRVPFYRERIQQVYPEMTDLENFASRHKLYFFYTQLLLTSDFILVNAKNCSKSFLVSDKPCFWYENFDLKFLILESKLAIMWTPNSKKPLQFQRWYIKDEIVEQLNALTASDAHEYIAGSNKEDLNEAICASKNHPRFLDGISK